MSLIERLFGRGVSKQYELQKMTHRGGWVNVAGPVEEVDELPERSEIEESGRFRVIERIDGRIRTEVWRYESPDCEAFYEERRSQAEQARVMERELELLREEVEKLKESP